MQQQYGNNRTGGPENLNDIELPKDNTRTIRDKIKAATKGREANIKQLEVAIKNLTTRLHNMKEASKKDKNDDKELAKCEMAV